MTSNQSPSPKPEARILSFRRGRASARARLTGAAPGLDKYERDNSPDDYRHRMLVNLAAFVFVILLVGAGYWLADTMARMRKDQDCVLSGRRGCSPVNVDIPRNRW
jgi:hypothetical protein